MLSGLLSEEFNNYDGVTIMKKMLLFSIGCCMTALLCGCAVENNYLVPDDFADCLRRSDIAVESVRPLAPDPFRATSACAVKVGTLR